MRRRSVVRPFQAVVAGLALVALTGCGSSPAEDPQTAPPADAPTAVEQRVPAQGTTGAITVTESSVVVGDTDAPETVHVYQDLNCPHCQVLHDLMAADVATWAEGSDIAVEFTVVDYLGPRTTHEFSSRGANLLALVADVDPEAWPAVQQVLLDMQPTSTTAEITDEDLLAAARGAGAEIDDAELVAVEQRAYSDWVDAATAQAAAAGVNYIPQVWIDGELVGGESHEETLALVREAVAD